MEKNFNRYISAHMHMHSCFEETASIEGHCHFAETIGIEVIFLSDHDTYMGARCPVNGYDFEAGLDDTGVFLNNDETLDDWFAYCIQSGLQDRVAYWRNKLRMIAEEEQIIRWKTETNGETGTAQAVSDDSSAYTGHRSMKLNVQNSKNAWKAIKTTFIAGHKGYNRTLFADIRVGIALRCPNGAMDNARFTIGFTLSQHPNAFETAELCYVAGVLPDKHPSSQTICTLPLITDNAWHYYILCLSEDAIGGVPGGLDNALNNIYITLETRNKTECSIWIDDLLIWDALQFNTLVSRLADAGREIGEKYGVTVFSAVEISEAGHHMNSFSENVPIMDYAAAEYRISHIEALKHLEKHCGIYSYNHPFSRYNLLELTEAERRMAVTYDKQYLTKTRLDKATCIEIGFPEGRYGFALKDFLSLWDHLGMAGIFVTGYGDSDNHWNTRRWYDDNNFVAFIAAAEPIRDNLLQGLLSGNVYSADPCQLTGMLQFGIKDGGAVMGQVVYAPQSREYTLCLFLSEGSTEWYLDWIEDGNVAETVGVRMHEWEYVHTFAPVQTVSLCRVSIRNKTGRCIALTNPIYFSRVRGIIPDVRLFDLST